MCEEVGFVLCVEYFRVCCDGKDALTQVGECNSVAM